MAETQKGLEVTLVSLLGTRDRIKVETEETLLRTSQTKEKLETLRTSDIEDAFNKVMSILVDHANKWPGQNDLRHKLEAALWEGEEHL